MDIIWTDTLIFKVFAILGANILAAFGTLSSAYIVFLIKDKRQMKKMGDHSWDLQTTDEEIINFKVDDIEYFSKRTQGYQAKKKQEENTMTNKKKDTFPFQGIKLSIINSPKGSDYLQSGEYKEARYIDSEKCIESSAIESNDEFGKGKSYTKETKKYL